MLSSTRSANQHLPKALSHIVTLQTARDVVATAFLPTQQRQTTEIVTVFGDGSATSWRINTSNLSIEEHEFLEPSRAAISCAAISHNTIWMAHENFLVLHSLSSTQKAQFKFQTTVSHLALSDNERIAAATLDGQIHLLDNNLDEVWNIETFSGVSALALSADGSKIAAGCDSGRVAVWNIDDTRDNWTTDTGCLWIADVGFSPNDNALALGDCDGRLQIRAAQNSAVLGEKRGFASSHRLCFLSDNRHLAVVCERQNGFNITLFDAWMGQVVAQANSAIHSNEKDDEISHERQSAWRCCASDQKEFALWSPRAIEIWHFSF